MIISLVCVRKIKLTQNKTIFWIGEHSPSLGNGQVFKVKKVESFLAVGMCGA
ncbi:hypothetical protein MTBPR1_10324 [Candidatus Terasakiella magnetica]|uniref:Uncharacterized protein n=1 Tax=Candidatus Terasakiella magnetica TaxID=1867952 RepID=A0A1C3RCS2_9PROT|nr:hypothetical protein MTBPR1_10324 [Candidatus Terasakiella magnetica]